MPETISGKVGTVVAFGDVVQRSKERSDDPEADGFERYLGLEHLEKREISIRSWGDIADGTTFTTVFRNGQVLFGKRRAYQRKVAVADFSGVCSGDIYVLEPKGDRLLAELLPFICQSESFYDYVISMSQGGLSPRVNWKALAKYEFELPPLEEQRRIVHVLQAAHRVSETYRIAAESGLEVLDAHVARLMSGQRCRGAREVPLAEACDRVIVGIASSATHAYRESGVAMVRNTNIKKGTLELDELLYLDPAFDAQNKSKRLRVGDVVTARTGNPGESAVVPASLAGCQTFTTLISSPDPSMLDSEYLCWWINGPLGKSFIRTRQFGGVQQNMNATLLKQMPIRIPPLQVQRDLVKEIRSLSDNVTSINERRSYLASVQRTLLAEVLRSPRGGTK
ncbi:MAG: restriction endonuclease subunit S [Ilumatobacter sp.]|uniref:restriction endonuclease subunit S n=1 Tax=Ilumatobacter sp. TaxID=1967498 RepID=UPI00391C9A0C